MGNGSSRSARLDRDQDRTLPERFGARLTGALDAQDARSFEGVLNEVTSAQQRATLASNLVHKGRSLLQYAAHQGSKDICMQLLQLGCSLDKMNSSPWGGSALHEAVAGLLAGPACPRQAAQLVETITLLLERGADPCLENAAGLTAMDMLQGRKPDPGAVAAAAGAGAAARSVGAGGGLLGLGGGLGLGRMLSVLQRAGSRRHASLLRAMEARAALTCCAARIQVHPFSSRDWSPVWLAVLPRRCSRPFGSAPRLSSDSPELVAFAGAGARKPLLRVLLSGCVVQRTEGAVRLLVLPCGKRRLKADFMRPWCLTSPAGGQRGSGATAGDGTAAASAAAATHWALHLRPSDSSDQHAACFTAFLDTCRTCGGSGGSGGLGPNTRAPSPRQYPAAHGTLLPHAGRSPAAGNPLHSPQRRGRRTGGFEERGRAEAGAAGGDPHHGGPGRGVHVQPEGRPEQQQQQGGQAQRSSPLPAARRLALPPMPGGSKPCHGRGQEEGRRSSSAGEGHGAAPAADLQARSLAGHRDDSSAVDGEREGEGNRRSGAGHESLEKCSAEAAGGESSAAGGGGSTGAHGDRGASAGHGSTEAGALPSPCATALDRDSLLVEGGGSGTTAACHHGGGGAVAVGAPGACSRCVICMESAPVVGFRHGHTVHCCACYGCAQGLLVAAGHQEAQVERGTEARGGQGGAGGQAVRTGSAGRGQGQGAAPAEATAVLCPLCRQEVQEVLLVYTA